MADLNSYYFSFERTGNKLIDNILEAICEAGHGSHNTDGWNDFMLSGDKTYIENIQEKAFIAAEHYGMITQDASNLFYNLKKNEDE